ncbi:MAG: helix-turn-helix domain-containing protein [Oscillospiraceae bacterium]|nr:helix-turn-helix domain-containing protein [Oscillospiraceae bacterium]
MVLHKLKEIRVERKLTQVEMAKSIGIGVSAYIERENGFLPFTQWEIERLKNMFDTTYENLFESKEKRDYSNGTK